jgi:hypothetical protein
MNVIMTKMYSYTLKLKLEKDVNPSVVKFLHRRLQQQKWNQLEPLHRKNGTLSKNQGSTGSNDKGGSPPTCQLHAAAERTDGTIALPRYD